MLEARCRHSEVEGLTVITGICEKAVNETAHKGISSAYPVHYMGDVIPSRLVQGMSVPMDSTSGTVVGV